MSDTLERARALESELVELRRELHRHPELSFQERRTAGLAAERVEALGWRVRRGVGRTGVIAELGSGSPVVALRADMDALPIQEQADHDYGSTVDGVMHACGHDAHVAMLIGAATILAERLGADGDGDGRGTVRLLFQPSEEASDGENRSGADRMIEDGALDGVDAIFGLHVGAHLPAGRAYVMPGPYMAGSDRFWIHVHGDSAHAGRPQEGTDAILLAAQLVGAVHAGVARALSPFATGVLNIGTVEGGSAENVVADRVSMAGTIRWYDEPTRDALHAVLRRAAAAVDAQGGRCEVEILPNYPPVVNDESLTPLVARGVADALGEDALATREPFMEAEDFAILAREVPGVFFWLGAALDPPRRHHHPRFDIDERVLPLGAAALASCALRALDELNP